MDNNIIAKDEKNHLLNKLKILIVEDDEASELLISLMIKNYGEVILIERSGLDAVQTCRNNPDIDLILMDIRMLDIDGYEATRLIRKFNKDVIVIAQTAFAFKGDREKALEAGCNDYISKPIDMVLLDGLLHKYFN